MPTDIEEGTKRQVFATNNDNTVATNIGSHVVANIRDVVYVSDKLPTTKKQRFVFELK